MTFDLRAASRTLRRTPGFTLIAVCTVAIGIAANTTLFSIYDRLVLNPVTIPDPASLVAIVTNNPQLNALLAYAVSRRSAEIGLRMALGARAGQVIGLVLTSGLRLVSVGIGVGIGVGLVAAAAAARLIQSLLFDVEPLDPRVYAAVAGVFAIVALVACLVPSIRAARIDPIVTLRPE